MWKVSKSGDDEIFASRSSYDGFLSVRAGGREGG